MARECSGGVDNAVKARSGRRNVGVGDLSDEHHAPGFSGGPLIGTQEATVLSSAVFERRKL
jgi:hypothetical protein